MFDIHLYNLKYLNLRENNEVSILLHFQLRNISEASNFFLIKE